MSFIPQKWRAPILCASAAVGMAAIIMKKLWKAESATAKQEKDGISYEVLQARDIAETADLFASIFADEPLTVSRGWNKVDWREFCLFYTKKSAEDGLTHIARDIKTGKIIGLMCSEDLSTDPPVGIEQAIGKIKPIFDALDHLSKQDRYLEERSRTLVPRLAFHLWCLGTHPSYRRRGIAEQLIEYNLKLAKEKGFKYGRVEVTGEFSRKAFVRYGFKEHVSLRYDQYKENGSLVFPTVSFPHRSLIAMWREL